MHKINKTCLSYQEVMLCLCISHLLGSLTCLKAMSCCKQTMINKYSNKHSNYLSKLRILNWQVADQLAIYKHSCKVELRATESMYQLAVRMVFEPGTYGFQIQCSNHSAMLPLLEQISHFKFVLTLAC